MSNNLEYYHNKGQEDAQSRDYEPPHGFFDELTTLNSERLIEENEAYDQGYFHTLGQIDQGDDDYDPPSDLNAKEAYDEGWEAAKNS
jgi:hypothetical protein